MSGELPVDPWSYRPDPTMPERMNEEWARDFLCADALWAKKNRDGMRWVITDLYTNLPPSGSRAVIEKHLHYEAFKADAKLICARADKARRDERVVRASVPWNYEAAVDCPYSGDQWPDVLRLIARYHCRVDPYAQRLTRVSKAWRFYWKVGLGVAEADVRIERLHEKRVLDGKLKASWTKRELEERRNMRWVRQKAEQRQLQHLVDQFKKGTTVTFAPTTVVVFDTNWNAAQAAAIQAAAVAN